ncbi:hypothetical protein [Pseudogracilibacillus auburnensis]|uniref:hypothetical protein n=1 Tax=Pseudogracilibacillus auburnensis TaxID=1494959 RepID=UPI001A95A289|nr:hypothetical protein [Pseudogracilibacillus auburnensis]MBO1002722.1 hypothetical protein [Pseudogracilibacillus auburnensis]
MNDLIIQENEYHAITFQSSYLQKQFRQSISNYFYNKTQSDCTYVNILDSSGNEINGKDFYFVSFDCEAINLTEDKATSKVLQEMLFYHLEHNPDILQEYVGLNEQINKFTANIEFTNGDLLIEFLPTEKTIMNLIKSFKISIEYRENEYVPNYVLREYLIETLLDLNFLDKNVFLLVSFPENDAGFEDFNQVIQLLKQLNVTTLVITSQKEFLIEANEGNIFLTEKNGTYYDIIRLRKELEAFYSLNPNELTERAKQLAFQDYTKDIFLLNDEMKKFLQSSNC